MKKITLFVILAIAFSVEAIAQKESNSGTDIPPMESKKIAIGGNLGFDYQQQKEEGGSSLAIINVSFLPEVEGFLTSKFSIGGTIGYKGSIPSGDYQTKTTSHSFIVGPYVKEYFSMGNLVAFFLKENLEMSVSSLKYESGNNSSKATGFGLGLGLSPGFVIKLSSKVHFETTFGLFGLSIARASNENYTMSQTNVSFKINPSAIQFGAKFNL